MVSVTVIPFRDRMSRYLQADEKARFMADMDTTRLGMYDSVIHYILLFGVNRDPDCRTPIAK